LYNLWIRTGMGLSYGDEQLWELLRKGQAIDPAYYPMYDTLAFAFTPRWGGSTAAIESVADHLYETLGEEQGTRYYATLAGQQVRRIDAWHFAEGGFLDWDRIDRGFTAQLKIFP